jgi:aspartate/glutamate racemase
LKGVDHIGIVACSAEGAALCYRTICLEGRTAIGEHDHPQVTMSSIPMARHMEAIHRDDWPGVGELLLESTHAVAAGGRRIRDLPGQHRPSGFPLLSLPLSDPLAPHRGGRRG